MAQDGGRNGRKFASLGKQVPTVVVLGYLRGGHTYNRPSAITSGASKSGITCGLGRRQRGRAEGGPRKRDLFFVPRWNPLFFLRSATVPRVPTTVCRTQGDSHSRTTHVRPFLGHSLAEGTR